MFHVKPTSTSTPPNAQRIQSVLLQSGITVTEIQADKLGLHARAVLKANEVTNLTRITEPEEFIRLHILDSLMPLRFADLIHGPVVDIGAGAGFPGIPLAIMGVDVTLCEARKKKAALLEQWSGELTLGAHVIPARAEEYAEGVGRFQWVVVRAVSSLASLVELAAPLLREGGSLLAMKGIRDSREEERGLKAANVVGLSPLATHEYILPGGDERRTLYILRRERPSQVRLPRRPGLAQAQPLP